METFEKLFTAFLTYIVPFFMLALCYDLARRRPRKRWDVFWAVWSGLFGALGVLKLVGLLWERAS